MVSGERARTCAGSRQTPKPSPSTPAAALERVAQRRVVRVAALDHRRHVHELVVDVVLLGGPIFIRGRCWCVCVCVVGRAAARARERERETHARSSTRSTHKRTCPNAPRKSVTSRVMRAFRRCCRLNIFFQGGGGRGWVLWGVDKTAARRRRRAALALTHTKKLTCAYASQSRSRTAQKQASPLARPLAHSSYDKPLWCVCARAAQGVSERPGGC